MKQLIKLYEDAIKELDERIKYYENYSKTKYPNDIKIWERIGFLKGKKEALEEVVNGIPVINMYNNREDD